MPLLSRPAYVLTLRRVGGKPLMWTRKVLPNESRDVEPAVLEAGGADKVDLSLTRISLSGRPLLEGRWVLAHAHYGTSTANVMLSRDRTSRGGPRMTHVPGLAPAIRTMRRAMRLCRFHFSTAAATQMTPTSSSVVFLKYSAATCRSPDRSPSWPRIWCPGRRCQASDTGT